MAIEQQPSDINLTTSNAHIGEQRTRENAAPDVLVAYNATTGKAIGDVRPAATRGLC